MKKNKFLSGLSAKLALAIVALSTAMFTSCEKENIDIDVIPVNATAYVNIIVVANNSEVTGAATITPSEGTITEYKGTYRIELKGNPTLESKTLKIDATYEGMTGTANVEIPALDAAETTSITAKIFLKYSNDNLEVVKDQDAEEQTDEIENPTPEVNEADWTNNTGNDITKSFTYMDIEGSKVLSEDYEGYDEVIKAIIDNYNVEYSETEKTMDIEIPAYNKVVPEVVTTKSIITYNIVTKTRAASDAIVTFTVEDYTTKVDATPVSIGHGHGHGNNYNAGGGSGDAN